MQLPQLPQLPHRRIARSLVFLMASLAITAASAQTAPSAPAAPASATTTTAPSAQQLSGPPPGFAAPALPRADESNAQRAKTQPGNNAPFWRGVRDSGDGPGVTNLPGPEGEGGVLVQEFVQYPGSRLTTAGEAWRQVRNDWIIPYGGALIVITLLALALYYFTRGPLGGHERNTGRKIERFTYFERAAHWVNAIAFCVLAISGLVMAFGKFLLLPIMGGTLFGGLTYGLKTVHNLVGPLFAVSLVIIFIVFVRDNFPGASDWRWLKKGGGLFGGKEPPSGRFNAGEKIVFWGGVFFLGILVVASGLVLDKVIPGLAYVRGDMQIAHMVHGVSTALMMALFLGHIYLGTLGMKGAYRAMKTGYVDEGWAEEHHALWYEDIRAGKVPAQRTRPVERPAAPAART